MMSWFLSSWELLHVVQIIMLPYAQVSGWGKVRGLGCIMEVSWGLLSRLLLWCLLGAMVLAAGHHWD
jgi:hypothetical protein